MTALRIYLIVAWTGFIVLCTFIGARAGMAGSFSDFGDAFSAMQWPAAYNLDLLVHLSLAGLWAGWRNGWTPYGWVMALLAFLGGTMVTAAYLLILLHVEKGDMRRVLLGQRAG